MTSSWCATILAYKRGKEEHPGTCGEQKWDFLTPPPPPPRPLAILQIFGKGRDVSRQKFMVHKTLQGQRGEGMAWNDKYEPSMALKVGQTGPGSVENCLLCTLYNITTFIGWLSLGWSYSVQIIPKKFFFCYTGHQRHQELPQGIVREPQALMRISSLPS